MCSYTSTKATAASGMLRGTKAAPCNGRITTTKSARSALRPQVQDRYNLNYFQQLIDVETVCENALRALKMEVDESKELTELIEEEEWKSQFDVPIVTKF